MAPEQAGGEIDRVDPRTDVFAIGALLYHVLTGRAPYSGSSNVQAVVRAAAGEYEPIRKVARDVPVALREVCERAMARDREDRYKSAAEIATALERCTATALRGGGSRVDVVIAGVVVFVLMGTIMGLTGTLQQTPTFAQQGTGAYGSAVFTGVATAVALAELRTKGRYALATIVLGIALATTFLALAMFGAGLANVASFAQAHPGDPAVLSGIAGASGSLATGASFAAFQIVLWAAIRRVGERSRHNA
jgi:hypothetical protein